MNQKNKDKLATGCYLFMMAPALPIVLLSMKAQEAMERSQKAETRNLRYYDITDPNPWKKIAIGMSTLAFFLLMATCGQLLP